MENKTWERDTTPYVVFACEKCHQYTYVKRTQKSKRCVRCGYTHIINKIKHQGEIVNGISKAVELVKQKQNGLAVMELGSEPEFRTSGDFIITGNEVKQNQKLHHKSIHDDYSKIFEAMLYNLSETHKSFPYYIIEIIAENYGIPQTEVKLLVRNFEKSGVLIRSKNYYYQVKLI
ncbi:MAG: hypothetical protein ACFFA7_06240 [Promethearchaeota archaeon]